MRSSAGTARTLAVLALVGLVAGCDPSSSGDDSSSAAPSAAATSSSAPPVSATPEPSPEPSDAPVADWYPRDANLITEPVTERTGRETFTFDAPDDGYELYLECTGGGKLRVTVGESRSTVSCRDVPTSIRTFTDEGGETVVTVRPTRPERAVWSFVAASHR